MIRRKRERERERENVAALLQDRYRRRPVRVAEDYRVASSLLPMTPELAIARRTVRDEISSASSGRGEM
jgi:hypothetical protein